MNFNFTVTPNGKAWMCCQRRGVTEIGDFNKHDLKYIMERHPRKFHVNGECRLMCRLHSVNQTLAELVEPREHEEFI